MCFIDSDDYVDTTMLERMVSDIERTSSEIAVCNILKHCNGEDTPNKFNLFEGTTSFEHMSLYDFSKIFGTRVSVFAWNKLYLRKIIVDTNLRFVDTKLILSEDQLFNICYFRSVKNACFINEPLYHYNIHAGTLSRSNKKPAMLEMRITLVRKIKDYINDTNLPKQKNYCYAVWLWYYFTEGCAFLKDDKSVIEGIGMIRDNRPFFNRCLLQLLFGRAGRLIVRDQGLSLKSELYFRYMVLLLLLRRYDKPVKTFLVS